MTSLAEDLASHGYSADVSAIDLSFTDYQLFTDAIGPDRGATVTGLRSIETTRRYTRALFDQHLRHIPQPLLNRASSCFPEVTIAAT